MKNAIFQIRLAKSDLLFETESGSHQEAIVAVAEYIHKEHHSNRQDEADIIRDETLQILQMRRRQLKNGIWVNYTFKNWFIKNAGYPTPHFEFYSKALPHTGYLSDYFALGQELTEDEILEAFDIRAEMFYEKEQKEIINRAKRDVQRKKKLLQIEVASQTLPLEF